MLRVGFPLCSFALLSACGDWRASAWHGVRATQTKTHTKAHFLFCFFLSVFLSSFLSSARFSLFFAPRPLLHRALSCYACHDVRFLLLCDPNLCASLLCALCSALFALRPPICAPRCSARFALRFALLRALCLALLAALRFSLLCAPIRSDKRV